MTQEALVDRLTNVERQSTISGWEADSRVPDPLTLVELADFYDVDLRWLLTGQGDRARRELPETQVRLRIIGRVATDANLDLEVLDAITSQDGDGRKRVLALLERLRGR